MKNNNNSKQYLANLITNIFNSDTTMQQLSKIFLSDDRKYVKNLYGNLLYYIVGTRTNGLSPSEIESLAKNHRLEHKNPVGLLIAKTLCKNYVNTYGAQPSNQQILDMFKHNFYDNGIYIHSFNDVNKDAIIENGLNTNKNTHSIERSFIEQFLPYEYSHRSNKNYVSGIYETAYGYGSISPEWLFSIVNDIEVFRTKNTRKALEVVRNNINKAGDASQHQQDKSYLYAEKIVNHYITPKSGIGVVLVDRFVKDNNGRRLFNRYNEEEMGLSDEAFQLDYLNKSLKNFVWHDESDNSKSIKETTISDLNNNLNLNYLGLSINYLINKGAHYELSTLSEIPSDKIAVAQIPCEYQVHEYINQKHREK